MSSEPGTVRRSADARVEGTGRVEEEEERGAGWVTFAGVLIMLAGILNLIYGIAAIAESSFYVGNTRFVFSDLKTWGWIVTIIGALECTVALGIWARSQWARWTGVGVAGLNAIAQLMFIKAQPWGSLAIFSLDVLVIYGLVAYGGRARATI
ncbi:MAG TPA: hypothetical protein VGX51_05080 [Solirubrobacteraceae bacterium]|jgi:hypothetical protein|nr:hypothetical protein [Solirubrobacteraceae bacterium]